MNAETQLFYISVAGLALAGVGLLWLIVAAFRVGWPWGVAVFVFPPLAPIFRIKHPREAARPFALLMVGVVVALAPIAYNKLKPIDLGPREKRVDGEIHLTLTGWDRTDYSILSARSATTVLQMANPDVTDATLVHLGAMAGLRELDLNGTKVDDEGLEILAGLPALETLRLEGTRITDEGFRRWLLGLDSLKQLDLRKTAVTKETGREWKAAKPGRRLLQ